MKKKIDVKRLVAGTLTACMIIGNNGVAYAAGTTRTAAADAVTTDTSTAGETEGDEDSLEAVSETGTFEDTPESVSEAGSFEETLEAVSEAASSSADEHEFAGGYIEMPWDNNTPVNESGLSYESATAGIVDNGEDDSLTEVGDTVIPEEYPTDYSETSALKSYVDDHLPPLRNQNPYGTCWAHSALGLIESYMMRHELSDTDGPVSKLTNYSELQLAYFYYHNNINPITGNDGDDTITVKDNDKKSFLGFGGNLGLAAQLLKTWRGVVSENDVPYSDCGSVIGTTPNTEGWKAQSGIDEKYAYSYDKVHLTNEYEINIQENTDAVKQAIMSNGMVGISFFADDSYYNETNNAFYNNAYTSTNHAVCIVGWDDNFPASSFNTAPSGNGAWLMRNSWKYDDVEQFSYYGYFWLSYYDTSLAETAYVFEAETAADYDNNYFYTNQTSNTGTWSFTKCANVFTVGGKGYSAKEKLEAVGVRVNKANVPYTISVYGVDADGKPSSTKLTEDVTGTFPYAGNYTIPLSSPCKLNKGDKFAVAVDTGDTGYVVQNEAVYEGSYYSTYVNVDEGESFFSSNGTYWTDFTYYSEKETYKGKYGNFYISALTTDVEEEDKLAAPEVTVIPQATEAELIWETVEGVARYAVYSGDELVGSTAGLTYTVTKLNPETEYSYKVYAYNGETENTDEGEPGEITFTTLKKLTADLFKFSVSPESLSYGDEYTVTVEPDTEKINGVEIEYGKIYSTASESDEWNMETPPDDAGTYCVEVAASGNDEYGRDYSITCDDWTYTIDPRDISSVEVSEIDDQEYTGDELTPAVDAMFNDQYLTQDTEYTLSYSDNINPGEAAVTITGVGNFTGKRNIPFNITKSMQHEDITITGIEDCYSYTGSPITPSVTVKDGDTLLVQDRDYTVTYSDNTDVGTAEVTIKGAGYYLGCEYISFDIVSGVQSVTLNENEHTLFVGENFTLTAEMSPKDAVYSSITWESNDPEVASVDANGTVTAVAAGIATITVTVDDTESDDCDVTVYKKMSADNFVFNTSDVTYDGDPHEADIEVGDDIQGGKMTYFYSKSSETVWTDIPPTDAGTYKVAIDFTGAVDYADVEKLTADNWTFTISPRSLSDYQIGNVDAVYEYTGDLIEPEIKVSSGTSVLVKDTDYTVTYEDNLQPGNATITVEGIGNYTGTLKTGFEIRIYVTEISIDKDELYIKTGGTGTLEAFVGPPEAYDRTVTWSSDNESIATVDEDGTVHGIAAGSVSIRATAKGASADGENYSVDCTVTVGDKDTLTADLFDFSVSPGTLTFGDEYTVTVTPHEEIAGNDVKVYYKSSDNSENWSETPPLNAGEYIVSADYYKESTDYYPFVEKLTCDDWKFTINPLDLSDETKTVSVTGIQAADYTGEPITQEDIKVQEGTGDSAVTLNKDIDYKVSYSNNVDPGTAVVTITGIGNYTGEIVKTFRIIKRATGVSLDKKDIVMILGEKSSLTASVIPDDADDKVVSWVSSDPDTVSVLGGTLSENGTTEAVLTAKAIGTADITVTTHDGGYETSCTVKVLGEQSASNFTFTASDVSYDGGTHAAQVVPNESIEGGTISIWYKGGSLGDEWTDTLPADAGTYSVAVDYSQVGSYSAAEKLTDDSWKFTVTPKDISGAVLTGIESSYDHTGEALEPAPVVSVQLKDGSVTLVKDTDYTVSYTDNVNKGTAKVTVTGEGNYTGSVIKTFEIVIRVTGIDIENSKLYLKPGEKAVLNAVVMPEDANDRSVSWSSSNDSVATVSEGEVTGVSAGDAIISAVTKDGAFKAEAVVTVLSEGENVADSDIYGDEEEYEKAKEEAEKEGRELGLWIAGDFRQEYVYTGAAIKPLPNVYYGTKLLIQESDYTVKYKNNTNAASLTDSKAPEITVKGKGIYSGSDTENFAITKASFEDDRDDFAISDIVLEVKNTKAQKPVPKITYKGKNLSAKKDFTVTYRVGGQESDSVSLDEGETKKEFEAVIKATDSGNYTGETVVTGCLYLKGESDVTVLPISKLKFTASPAACVYDGAEQKPSFTASYNSKDVSFEISADDAEDYFDTVYGNNVDQGKGKMTISGKAVYTATDGSKYVFTGNKTLTFQIDRFDLKDAEIVFSSVEQNEDGSYTGVLPYEKAGAKPGVLVSFTGKVTADDGSVSEEKVYLRQGCHYKVKYKYTDKDKTGITVTVSGTGNFTGSKALSGTTAAVTLRENAVAVAEDVISGKDPSKVSVKVYDEYGTLLKKGKDYVYDPQTDISEDESQSAKDEGEKTYTLTLHGVGVYAANEGGDLTCSFKSYDKAYKFASAKQLTKPEKNYTGSAVELTEEDLTGMLGHKEKDKLVPGTDFEVVVYQKNVKPGTAKAILRGLGQFGGSKTITIKIQKRAF